MLENLINDLLDLAKLENNQFSFNFEYFDLTKVIFDSFETLLHQANSNKI